MNKKSARRVSLWIHASQIIYEIISVGSYEFGIVHVTSLDEGFMECECVME